MSLTHCATCGHKFKADETLWADGGLIEINHGGGRCRSCFLAADNRWECTDCLTILGDNMKFCWQCGKRRGTQKLTTEPSVPLVVRESKPPRPRRGKEKDG